MTDLGLNNFLGLSRSTLGTALQGVDYQGLPNLPCFVL